MAKQIEAKLDDYGFDMNLDDFDYDFEDSFSLEDDRKPVTRFASGMVSGAKGAVTSPQFAYKVVDKVFPPGYKAGLDQLLDAKDSVSEIYSQISNDLAPVVNQVKSLTNKVLPTASRFIPGSLSKRIKDWANDNKGKIDNYESLEDREIKTALGEIFSMQSAEEDKRREQDDVKDRIKDNLNFQQHKDNISQLNEIRSGISQLVTYQNKISANYQKKSLELQFKQFFVLRDTLLEAKRSNLETKNFLEIIGKNTALPEYVKLTQSERLGQSIKNKFFNQVSETIMGGDEGFIKRLIENVGGKVRDKIGSFTGDLSMALSMADMIELGGDGPAFDVASEGGSILGDYLVNKSLGTRLGTSARQYLNKIPGFKNLGLNILSTTQNIPQHLAKFAKSDFGSNTWYESIANFGKESILETLSRSDSLDIRDNSALSHPGVFSQLTNKSIIEIIPGLLSKIHHELAIIRTGDDSISPIEFDFVKNKFNTISGIKSNLRDKFLDSNKLYSTTDSFEKILQLVDSNNSLTKEEKNEILQTLLKGNLNNQLFDHSSFQNNSIFNNTKFNKLFSSYTQGEGGKDKSIKLNSLIRSLGRDAKINLQELQDFVNYGQGDYLLDLGFIDSETGNIDYGKFLSLITSNEINIDRESSKNSFKGDTLNSILKDQIQNDNLPYRENDTINSGISEELTYITELLKENNPNVYLALIDNTLTSIDERLSQGLLTVNLDNLSEDDKKRFDSINKSRVMNTSSNRNTIISGLKLLWKGGLGATKGGIGIMRDMLTNITSKGVGSISSIFKGVSGVTSSLFNTTFGRMIKEKALYLKGRAEPIITEAGLKAGRYFDENGVVIKSFRDIRGRIFDENGNLLIDTDDLKNLYEKTSSNIIKPFKTVGSIVGGILKGGYNLTKDAFERLRLDDKLKTGLSLAGTGVSYTAGKIKDGFDWLRSPSAKDKFTTIGDDLNDKYGEGVTNFGKYISNPIKSIFGGAREGIGGLLGGMTSFLSKAFDPIFRGGTIVKRLTEIRDLIDQRIPDNRIRQGSYEDQMLKKEDDDTGDSKGGLTDSLSKGFAGTPIGMLASGGKKLWDKLKGKGEGEGDSNIYIGGALGALGGIKGALKWGGRTAAVGFAGYETYNVLSGNKGLDGNTIMATGLLAVMFPKATLAIAQGLWAAMPAITSAAVAAGSFLLTNPIGWAILGATAVGTAGYFAYKFFTKKRPQDLSTLRMMQYGVDPNKNEDQFNALLNLEETLTPLVKYTDGGATVEPSGNSLEDEQKQLASVFESFNLDPTSPEDTLILNDWLEKRFLPIFLPWMSARKKINDKVKISDIDDNFKGQHKNDLFKIVSKIPVDFQYNILPFKPFTSSPITADTLKKYIDSLNLKFSSKGNDDSDKGVKSLPSTDLNSLELGALPVSDATTLLDSNLLNVSMGGSVSGGINSALDKDVIGKLKPIMVILDSDGVYNGTLNTNRENFGLHLRMMQYGSDYNNESKYRQLYAMDLLCESMVKFETNQLTLKITDLEKLSKIYKIFDIDPDNEDQKNKFGRWVTQIYSPILIDYVRSLNKFNGFNSISNLNNLDLSGMSILLETTRRARKGNFNYSPWNLDQDLNIPSAKEINSYVNDSLAYIKSKIGKNPSEGSTPPTLSRSDNGLSDDDKDKIKTSSLDYTPPMDDASIRGNQPIQYSEDPQIPSQKDSPTSRNSDSTFKLGFHYSQSFGSGDQSDYKSAPRVTLNASQAEEIKNNIIRMASENGITDENELAMLLAQAHHESAGFTSMEENLNYRPERLLDVFPRSRVKNLAHAKQLVAGGASSIANAVYGNRMGNGPDEGYKYRGRGPIQITGKANYAAASKEMGIDIVNHPDLVATDPVVGAKAMFWWWKHNNTSSKPIRLLSQKGDVRGTTKIINGGYNGLSDRTELFKRYKGMIQRGELDNSTKDIQNNGVEETTFEVSDDISTTTDVSIPDTNNFDSVDEPSFTGSGSDFSNDSNAIKIGYGDSEISLGDRARSSGSQFLHQVNLSDASSATDTGGMSESPAFEVNTTIKDFVAKLNPEFIELGKKSYMLYGNVDLSGMNKYFMLIFYAMIGENRSNGGQIVQINSAYRSVAKQKALYDQWVAGGKRGSVVGKPGKSRHGQGIAIDINSPNANELQAKGLMDKYLFHRPIPKEPWHLENRLFSSNQKGGLGADAAQILSGAEEVPDTQLENSALANISTSIDTGNDALADLNSLTSRSSAIMNSPSQLQGGFNGSDESIATQQLVSESSYNVGGLDLLVDSINDGNNINREILNVNSEQLSILKALVELVGSTKSMQSTVGSSEEGKDKPPQLSTGSSDVMQGPVGFRKKYTS